MAYKILVRPIVEYSSTVWSPHTDQNIEKLEMIQRRVARWTLHNYSTYAVSWRSLEQRRSDSRLCLFYKIIHGLVAIDLPPYVVHPLRILRNSHPFAFAKFRPLRITTSTHSTPSQSCNGTGCHHTQHFCPLLTPLRGQCVQSITKCHKCQHAVFNILAITVSLFLAFNILTLSSFTPLLLTNHTGTFYL